MAIAKLTAQRLREVIDYDPGTGAFCWKPRAWRDGPRCNDDRSPGSVSTQTGYLTIRIDRKLYQAHRLAWLHAYGEWPAYDLDHIDGNRLNNRISNLRDVGNAVNRENVHRARADSATGVQGVSSYKNSGRFQAQIRSHGKQYWLGTYATVEEARAMYLAAKRLLHAGWVPQADVRVQLKRLRGIGLPQSGKRARCDSTSGVRGVSPHQGKWKARCAGRYIGVFATVAEAEAAYQVARQASH